MNIHQRKSRASNNRGSNDHGRNHSSKLRIEMNANDEESNKIVKEHVVKNYRRRRTASKLLAPCKEWVFSIIIFCFVMSTLLFGPVYYNSKSVTPSAYKSTINPNSNLKKENILRGRTNNSSFGKVKPHHHHVEDNNDLEDGDTDNLHRHPFVDKSPWYRKLRQEYDLQQQLYPLIISDEEREEFSTYDQKMEKLLPLLEAVQKIRYSTSTRQFLPIHTNPNNTDMKSLPYDVFDCPRDPPKDYPIQFSIVDLLQNWNPDDVFYNENYGNKQIYYIYQGLCVFDYFKLNHYEFALNYQRLEVPFVLKNHPQVLPTVIRWATPNYLERLLRDTKQRTEYSKNNHFMFWRLLRGFQKKNQQWRPPTDNIQLTYTEWVAHVKSIIGNKTIKDYNNQEHWYFRLNGCISMVSTEDCDEVFLFDELPFFQPEVISNFFLIDSSQYRGINCRFGMAGAIAGTYFNSYYFYF
jgi:hypothetical protein